MQNRLNNKEIWINPLGGLGDTLMVSGILKIVVEDNPSRKFNLIRRTKYLSILKGHPAISTIGYPSKDANIVGTDYWSKEELGADNQRAFQILARIFGLKTPVDENLYLHGELEPDPMLDSIIPWQRKNIIIAPFSDSPRKVMHQRKWHNLVDRLKSINDVLVMQVGKIYQLHIKNTYSLIGLTTPRQLISLIKKCDMVITSDNFIMHAAHLVGTPAVVLWGPTEPFVYGYKEQRHLKFSQICKLAMECIGPKFSSNYAQPCHFGEAQHCMNLIEPDDIYSAVREII
ncbi:MAG: hypothetical protein HQL06_16680 [Nitrospirae bacterium]|nr:hypothetical protein [Nitrospirota bacterium]